MANHLKICKEEKIKSFIGKKVRITHKDSIFYPAEGVCKDAYANPPGQDENFEMLLDSGSFFGIIPAVFGENFVEGTIHRASGRRKIEIVE
jgi:hypothetical protein